MRWVRTALVPGVFVGIVQTIVVTVADVNPGHAVAIVAGEEIAKTRSALTPAILRRLIAPVTAVIITVTVPSRGDATMIWTSVG